MPSVDILDVEDKSRTFWIGIGCQKGVSKNLIETAVLQVCDRYNIPIDALAGIATIDIKANEPGLVEFCGDRNLPLVTFSKKLLDAIEVPNSSEIVAAKTGIFSVAEAAVICATNSYLIVSKQVFKLPEHRGAVTLAISQS